jgi:hypothetical protein
MQVAEAKPLEGRVMKSLYISFSVMLTNLIVLLIVFNLALFAYARVARYARSRLSRHPTSNSANSTTDPSRPEIKLKDLAKETWATVMLRNYDYDPITQLRLHPLHGRYVNVEEGGFRRVWGQGPWPLDRSALNIFLFGGSTTFGLSLDDDQTIPSSLQQRTRAASQRLNVYNFGRPGYTSTQELLLYLSLLRDGSVPNAAVFIDGLNECQEWTSTPPSGAHWPDEYVYSAIENAKRNQGVYMLPLQALPMAGLASSIAERFGLDQRNETQGVPSDVQGFILNRWLKNKKVIEVLSRGYEVNVSFVWQPVAAYKYDLRYYKFPHKLLQDEAYVPTVYSAIEKMARQGMLGEDFLNLAEMQKDKKESLYIDPWHYNEAFSREIASQIYLYLRNRGTVN